MEGWIIEQDGEEIEIDCNRVTDFETDSGTYVDIVYYENGKDVEFVIAVVAGTYEAAEISGEDWDRARKKAILAILADAA